MFLRYNVRNCLVLDSHQQFTGYVHVTVTSTRHMEVTLHNRMRVKNEPIQTMNKIQKDNTTNIERRCIVQCNLLVVRVNPDITIERYEHPRFPLAYRTMYRGHIALSVLLGAVTLITVTINPIVHINRLIILKHFIISFCLREHYITTLCCCQVVFLIIVL